METGEEISEFSRAESAQFYRPTGFSSPAENYREEVIDLNEVLMPNRAASHYVRLSSESMEPDIPAGSHIVIDRKINYSSGNVVAARINSDFYVGIYHKTQTNEAYLVFPNPEFATVVLNEDVDFEVWGTVTHSVKSHGRHSTR